LFVFRKKRFSKGYSDNSELNENYKKGKGVGIRIPTHILRQGGRDDRVMGGFNKKQD